MNPNSSFAKAALLLFSLAMSLLFVEIFARVYLAAPIALIPRYGNSFQSIFLSPVVIKAEGSPLPWELKPNLDGYFKLTKFATNSRGLRSGRDFEIQKPAGMYRLAVIGDSFTMPSGVSIEDAYHSILEKSLNTSSGRRFEVLNFGVGGYSLQNYLTVLEEKALEYRPDHILVGLCLFNDLPLVKKTKSITKPARDKPRPYSVLTLRNPYYGYWTLDLIGQARSGLDSKEPNKKIFDLEELDRILGAFRRVRDEHRVEMTFVALKTHSAQGGERYETFSRHLEKHSLNLLDAGSEFDPRPANKYATTRLDRHPNALAHRKFANVILQGIAWNELIDSRLAPPSIPDDSGIYLRTTQPAIAL